MSNSKEVLGSELRKAVSEQNKRPIIDIHINELENQMPDKAELEVLNIIIDRIKFLTNKEDEANKVVLGWIESLVQYGVDYLENLGEKDYRLEIFRLYFNLSHDDGTVKKDTIKDIITVLERYRGDLDFAGKVKSFLKSKLGVLEQVYAEKAEELERIKIRLEELMTKKRNLSQE